MQWFYMINIRDGTLNNLSSREYFCCVGSVQIWHIFITIILLDINQCNLTLHVLKLVMLHLIRMFYFQVCSAVYLPVNCEYWSTIWWDTSLLYYTRLYLVNVKALLTMNVINHNTRNSNITISMNRKGELKQKYYIKGILQKWI